MGLKILIIQAGKDGLQVLKAKVLNNLVKYFSSSLFFFCYNFHSKNSLKCFSARFIYLFK